jgi:hypothetical protein
MSEPLIQTDRLKASAVLGGRECICDGVNANLCHDGYSLRLWGVRRPATAPTATAATGSGSVSAGAHLVAITFAIVKAGNVVFAESNCQDAEITVTVAAPDNEIELTDLPDCDNDAVTHYVVYMSPAGSETLLRVALVPIAATDYTIAAADAALELLTLDYTRGLLPAKPFVIEHHNRLLLWGDVPWSRGSAAVENDSDVVTFTDAELTRAAEGKKFRLAGSATDYLIASVDVAAQTATLSADYAGADDAEAAYQIAGDPHQLYVSNALPFSPEGYDLEDGNTVIPIAQDDGDLPRGLMSDRALLYCAKRRHIYLLAGDGPANYQREEIKKSGGLAGHRAWAQLGDGPLMYYGGDGGIYLLSGNSSVRVSQAIDPLLRDGVNHARDEWAHAVYYAPLNLWMLCVTAVEQEKMADLWIVADCSRGYTEQTISWWLWRLPAATSRVLVGADGLERVILGDYHGGVSIWGAGSTDGADAAVTHTGTLTSATNASLSETGADFDVATVGDLTGVVVSLLSGACAGQQRFIASHENETLTLDTRAAFGGVLPAVPQAGDRYQLGRIAAHWATPLLGSIREVRRWLQAEIRTTPVHGGGALDVQMRGLWHGQLRRLHQHRLLARLTDNFVVPLGGRCSLAQLYLTNATTAAAAPWRLRGLTVRPGTGRGVR